jgi:23S rRNA (cytidine1920-2'-O)/16S rRNA (cytidine1409-2'-O)-methyltransferase
LKARLDKILIDRGLVLSRERAKALIMGGKVLVAGAPVTKAGTLVNTEIQIELKGVDIPFVSRGGLKLESALEHFQIDLTEKVVMDVGASTGGFTDCMLQRKAARVYAIDVGYGQLSWKLRNDPRVIVLERQNIRKLNCSTVPESIDFATIDVSFISLLKVVPKVAEFLKVDGNILALVKPQFEVGKGEVEKGGVIRNKEKRESTVRAVRNGLETCGFIVNGLFESPIPGQKGNVEYFIHLTRQQP